MAAEAKASSESSHQLARTMGLGALTIYGIGDMLGAGVYGTMGKVAGQMGNAVWLAYLVSMFAAMFTGLSYASLGSRYPKAAGAAYITQKAFNLRFLAYAIGLAITASGLTSFATQSRSFAGYLLNFFELGMPGNEKFPVASIWLVVGLPLAFIAVLTFINLWGMKEATWLNAVCTSIEVSGLVIVIVVGLKFWGGVNLLEIPPVGKGDPVRHLDSLNVLAPLALSGAVLTFYSFIGFEDMINVTEEVKDPERNFPRAVIIALICTAVVYMAVAISAVSVLGWKSLSASDQPLVDVVLKAAPWFPQWAFTFIALFAITNTALLNFIMGSRMVYGMAKQGLVPRALGVVHPVRRTPHRATLVLAVIVAVLMLAGDITTLAASTSMLLLAIFVIVNAALIVLQKRPDEPKGQFEVPPIIPALGIVICLAVLSKGVYDAVLDPKKTVSLYIAGGLLFVITVLYFALKPTTITEDSFSEG